MKQKIITFGGPPRKTNREQATAQNARRRRKRRTGRQTLNYLLIFLIALAIMTTLSLTVFFKIEKVEVSGNDKYAPQALVELSGIKRGDNLFRISEKQISRKLVEKYPYIQKVDVKRHFPSTVELAVTQETPLGAVDTAAGYVVVGTTGRVLETGAQSVPSGLTVVTGMYLYEPVPGQMLGAYGKDKKEHAELEMEGFKMLSYLVDAVRETDFAKITMVDFSDRLNMMIVYDDRIIIELGSEADLVYKLSGVDKLIQEQLSDQFEGILDATNAASSKRFRADPCNVQEELARRNLTATAKAQAAQEQALLPVTTPATTPAGASSSATEITPIPAASEENKVGYSPEDLEVIPGTAKVSSAPEQERAAPQGQD